MTDDQHGEGAPRSGGRWDPLPQGDYDDGATAFVKLPEGGIDALLASADSPLAAPGHGYVPPRITATPDQAQGEWGTPEGGQWPDPNQTPHEGGDDRFTYRLGAAQQWTYDGHQVPETQDPGAVHQDGSGQWSIPLAGGDLPDESGEFTTSSLVQQWGGGTPPATLPGGASAPWATEQPEPAGPLGPHDPTGLSGPAGPLGPQGQPWGQDPGVPGNGHEHGNGHGPDQGHRPDQGHGLGHTGQAHGTPAHGAPAHGTPAHGTQLHGTPAYGTPAPGIPAQGTPAQGTPVHGTPPYGTPDHGTQNHGTPAHGTPMHGVPGQGVPGQDGRDHGVPDHGVPDHGGQDQGVPDHLRHGTPALGTPAHGVPVVDAHAPVAPDPAVAPDGRPHAPEHDVPPHAGEFPGDGQADGQARGQADGRTDDRAADAGHLARHPEAEPASGLASGLVPAPGATEPAPAAPAAAEGPGEAAAADESGDASEAVQRPAEAAEGPAEPDASPTPDATDPAVADEPAATPSDDPPPPTGDEHPLASYVLRVNGVERPVTDAWIGESLLYVLRERLGLAGAKDGCSQGECGACNVQVDGRLVASCLVPAVTAAGSEVRTVEGLAEDGRPSDVQRALARCGAVQCGFCVPGMAMTVHDLLEGNPAPTELETRQALCGNLCRCSGYRGVLNAVNEVVAEREAHSAEPQTEHDGDEPRIPHQAGPGSGGVNPSAFDPSTHDQAYGQDGGQP
ncbi:2Fe-2S iron-sulfur cluster-binding protein [Streptomyces griseoviridis]